MQMHYLLTAYFLVLLSNKECLCFPLVKIFLKILKLYTDSLEDEYITDDHFGVTETWIKEAR